MRIAYTAKVKEVETPFKVERITCVVPRAKDTLVIYMTAAERNKFPEKTFHAILNSLKIEG